MDDNAAARERRIEAFSATMVDGGENSARFAVCWWRRSASRIARARGGGADDARSVDSRGKHSAISEISGTKAGGEEVQEGELGSSATEPGPSAQGQEGDDGAASSEKEKVHELPESVVESPKSKNLSKTSTIDSLGGE